MSDSDGPESVIAACIKRFRYGAPSPSESRSHISVGKFWWLNSPLPGQDRVSVGAAMEETRSSSSDIDRFMPATMKKEASLIRFSRDHPSFDSEIPKQRDRVPVRSEMFKYDSDGLKAGGKKMPLLPREEPDSADADLEVVLSLDSYAERLLTKCDLLLKGYSIPSFDTKPVSRSEPVGRGTDRGRGNRAFAVTDDPRTLSSQSRGAMRSISQGIESDSDDDDDDDESCSDSNNMDSSNPFPHAAWDSKDLGTSSQSHLLDMSVGTADIGLSPVGQSLALSADSWSDLLLQGDAAMKPSVVTATSQVTAKTVLSNESIPEVKEAVVVEGIPVSPATCDNDDALPRGKGGASEHSIEGIVDRNSDPNHVDKRNVAEAANHADDNDNYLSNMKGAEPHDSCSSSSSSSSSPRSKKPSRAVCGEASLYLSSSSEMDLVVRAANRRKREGGDNRENRGSRENSENRESKDDSRAEGEGAVSIVREHRISGGDAATRQGIKGGDGDNDGGHGGHCEGAAHACTRAVVDGVVVDGMFRDGIDVDGVDKDDCEDGESVPSTISTSTDHPPEELIAYGCPPLSLSDVTPYLEDEITRSLWTRLSLVRSLIAQQEQQGGIDVT